MNKVGTVYLDAAGTVLADIRLDNGGAPGAAYAGSQVTTDAFGFLPFPFWGPTGDVDRLYITVNGGPLWPIDADYNARLDTVAAVATAAETPAGAQDKANAAQDAATSAAAADATGKVATHAADTTDVHGIPDTAVLETTSGAQAKADAALVAAITDAGGKYARVFPVPAPTGVAATDTAAIIAQANAASAAGGGIVALRAGIYPLSGPLPVLSGVTYVGVEPIVVPQTVTDGAYMGDMEWNYAGGTVLTGDGTFAAFEANAVDQGSVSPTIGSTQISNAGIVNVGIDNVTYGVHVGAVNIMGMVWGTLRNVYVKRASQWGVKLVNFQHCEIDNIRTCLVNGHQYYGNLLPALTLMCGNSTFGELFAGPSRDGRDTRKVRGIVFEAGGLNAVFNELKINRVQVNHMGRNKLAVTATTTNASTSIAVPDGTLWAAGMPVYVVTTAQGFTGGQCYVVASVVGNALTLANDRVSAAISATGTGNLSLETYGWPNLEITRANSGAKVHNFHLGQIDVEGSSTAAIYVDGAETGFLFVSEFPTATHFGVVGRSARWLEFRSQQSAPTDFDANSASSSWFGQRAAMVGRQLSGMWLDSPTGSRQLAIGGGQNGQIGGDIQTRTGGFLYPNAPLGERIFPRDTAITLGGFNGGDIVFAGASPVTMTLPTIVGDSNVNNSHIGVVFEIYNVGSGTLTIATDGTQTMNKVAGRVSTTVAPGNSLKVIACKDNAGNLFWLARASALVS